MTMKNKIEFQHWSNIYHQPDSEELTDDNIPNTYEFKSMEERFSYVMDKLLSGSDKCQMLVGYDESGEGCNTVFITREAPQKMIQYFESFLMDHPLVVLYESDHEDCEQLTELIPHIIYS